MVWAGPGIPVTRWTGPGRPNTRAEWLATQTVKPTWEVRCLRHTGNTFDSRIDVMVEAGLVDSLASGLDTMVSDLLNEDYEVALFSISGSSPESLRSFLRTEYDSGLVSAVFVGDLPVAWFQLINDFQGNGSNDGYEEFPCDLFFMDLDGTWQDDSTRYSNQDSLVPGSDGIYDVHVDSVAPEIGISRLHTSTLGDELSLLRGYLDKTHRYRAGQLVVSDRALVYIDDDWHDSAFRWNRDVGYLYPDRVSMWDPESTRAADYRPRVDSAAYEWIQLCAHSSPAVHAWKYNNGQSWDRFYATEVAGVDPEACFYNLFCCSNVRYVTAGYMGGRYVFETTMGLAAIGSCKTGSMLEFGQFYWPLGTGQSLSSAFTEWFRYRAQDWFERWERSWFYGMALVGDGLLRPRLNPTGVREFSSPTPSPKLAVSSPISAKLSFQLTAIEAGPITVSLADRSGRVVFSHGQALSKGTHLIRADVQGLPAGAYLLSVDSQSGRLCRPVAVLR
jgi:hypothetical protein